MAETMRIPTIDRLDDQGVFRHVEDWDKNLSIEQVYEKVINNYKEEGNIEAVEDMEEEKDAVLDRFREMGFKEVSAASRNKETPKEKKVDKESQLEVFENQKLTTTLNKWSKKPQILALPIEKVYELLIKSFRQQIKKATKQETKASIRTLLSALEDNSDIVMDILRSYGFGAENGPQEGPQKTMEDFKSQVDQILLGSRLEASDAQLWDFDVFFQSVAKNLVDYYQKELKEKFRDEAADFLNDKIVSLYQSWQHKRLQWVEQQQKSVLENMDVLSGLDLDKPMSKAQFLALVMQGKVDGAHELEQGIIDQLWTAYAETQWNAYQDVLREKQADDQRKLEQQQKTFEQNLRGLILPSGVLDTKNLSRKDIEEFFRKSFLDQQNVSDEVLNWAQGLIAGKIDELFDTYEAYRKAVEEDELQDLKQNVMAEVPRFTQGISLKDLDLKSQDVFAVFIQRYGVLAQDKDIRKLFFSQLELQKKRISEQQEKDCQKALSRIKDKALSRAMLASFVGLGTFVAKDAYLRDTRNGIDAFAKYYTAELKKMDGIITDLKKGPKDILKAHENIRKKYLQSLKNTSSVDDVFSQYRDAVLGLQDQLLASYESDIEEEIIVVEAIEDTAAEDVIPPEITIEDEHEDDIDQDEDIMEIETEAVSDDLVETETDEIEEEVDMEDSVEESEQEIDELEDISEDDADTQAEQITDDVMAQLSKIIDRDEDDADQNNESGEVDSVAVHGFELSHLSEEDQQIFAQRWEQLIRESGDTINLLLDDYPQFRNFLPDFVLLHDNARFDQLVYDLKSSDFVLTRKQEDLQFWLDTFSHSAELDLNKSSLLGTYDQFQVYYYETFGVAFQAESIDEDDSSLDEFNEDLESPLADDSSEDESAEIELETEDAFDTENIEDNLVDADDLAQDFDDLDGEQESLEVDSVVDEFAEDVETLDMQMYDGVEVGFIEEGEEMDEDALETVDILDDIDSDDVESDILSEAISDDLVEGSDEFDIQNPGGLEGELNDQNTEEPVDAYFEDKSLFELSSESVSDSDILELDTQEVQESIEIVADQATGESMISVNSENLQDVISSEDTSLDVSIERESRSLRSFENLDSEMQNHVPEYTRLRSFDTQDLLSRIEGCIARGEWHDLQNLLRHLDPTLRARVLRLLRRRFQRRGESLLDVFFQSHFHDEVLLFGNLVALASQYMKSFYGEEVLFNFDMDELNREILQHEQKAVFMRLIKSFI